MQPEKRGATDGYLLYVSPEKSKKEEMQSTDKSINPHQKRQEATALNTLILPMIKDMPLFCVGLVACFGIVGYGFYCSKVPALNHRVNKMFKLSTGAQFFTASVLMWSLYRNELSRQAKQTETNNEG